jgi:hypothetical protein
MRLNFEFSEEKVKELKDLQRKSGCANMKELFNNALSIFEWTVDQAASGNDVAAINEKEKFYRVLVAPVLQSAAKQAKRASMEQRELVEV